MLYTVSHVCASVAVAWRTVLPSNVSGNSIARALADAMKRGSVQKRESASERVISSSCARMRRGRVAGSRRATLRMLRPLATLGRALERSLAKLKPEVAPEAPKSPLGVFESSPSLPGSTDVERDRIAAGASLGVVWSSRWCTMPMIGDGVRTGRVSRDGDGRRGGSTTIAVAAPDDELDRSSSTGAILTVFAAREPLGAVVGLSVFLRASDMLDES